MGDCDHAVAKAVGIALNTPIFILRMALAGTLAGELFRRAHRIFC